MFRPFKPNRQETETPAPKPKRTIRADVSEIRRIIAEIKREFGWYADTGAAGEANLLKLFSWLQDNDATGFTLENVRVAVRVLGDEIEYDPEHNPVAPPPPPPPKPEPEKLEPGQIPLSTPSYAIKQVLAKASAAQIKDYLDRARKAAQN